MVKDLEMKVCLSSRLFDDGIPRDEHVQKSARALTVDSMTAIVDDKLAWDALYENEDYVKEVLRYMAKQSKRKFAAIDGGKD